MIIFYKPRALYFSKALFEGFIFGGKFAFQNRLGWPYRWKEIYRFCFILLFHCGQFPSTSPLGGLYLGGNLTEGFLRHEFEGLIHGGAYFRNFTVSKVLPSAAVPLPLSSGNLTQSYFLNTTFFFIFLPPAALC